MIIWRRYRAKNSTQQFCVRSKSTFKSVLQTTWNERPLPAKSAPFKLAWDNQSLLRFPSAILSFCCTDEASSIFLLGVDFTGQGIIIVIYKSNMPSFLCSLLWASDSNQSNWVADEIVNVWWLKWNSAFSPNRKRPELLIETGIIYLLMFSLELNRMICCSPCKEPVQQGTDS